MNEALVCFFLVFLAFIFFIVLITIDVYAFDYYETAGYMWDEAPIICLNDYPDYKLFYGLKGITEWRDRLPEGFDYRVLVGEYEECTVNIHNVKDIDISIEPDEGNIFIGNASCISERFTRPTGIVVEEKYIVISCDIIIRDGIKNYGNTIRHEMGHVLGLGHRTIYEAKSVVALVETNDIMLHQSFGIQKITEEGLLSLRLLYGDNGFEPPNIYNVATIRMIHEE